MNNYIDKKPYFSALQSLRFFFIFLIFLTHLSFISGTKYETKWGPCVAGGGPGGVSFFIVLSGFLLTVKYYDVENIVTIKENLRFMIGKVKYLFPLHLITGILCVPFILKDNGLIWGEGVNNLDVVIKVGVILLCNIFLIQSYIPITVVYFSLNAVSWYLSDCTFFWFIFRYVIKVIKYFKNKIFYIIIPICLFQIMMCLLLKSPLLVHAVLYINPIYRSLDFVIGCIAGYFYLTSLGRLLSERSKAIFTVLELAGIVAYFIVHINYLNIRESFAYGLVYLPISTYNILIFSYERGLISKLLLVKQWVWLGNISFEFYLIHKPIIKYLYVLSHRIILNPFIYSCIALLLSLLCSIIWYKYIKSKVVISFINEWRE